MALKFRLALAFSLLFLVLFGVLWLTLKLLLDQTLSQQTRTLGDILAKQTAGSVTELVLANDLLGLNVVLGELSREPGISSVTVADVDGRTLATTLESYAEPLGPMYEAPITLQEAVAGRVLVTLDEELLSNPLARPHTLFYGLVVLGLLAIGWLSWTLSRRYSEAVYGLIDLVERPPAADEDFVLARQPSRELDHLQQRVADLLLRQQSLEAQIENTGLPDPDEMKQLTLRAERRMGSLLLVEAVNINTAIELLHPATLSTLLQEYQFYLRQAARLYRGTVLRVEGNKALVSFDVRHCQDDHAFAALCCAQLFLRLMQRVAARHKANNAQSLEFAVVVHSGDSYYSPLWKKKKDGKESQREETVIGKPVELAQHLLGTGPAGKVLASELALELAGGQKRFGAVSPQELQVGPDKLPLMAYILAADSGSHSDLLERQCLHLIPEHGTAS
jgi:membrane protein